MCSMCLYGSKIYTNETFKNRFYIPFNECDYWSSHVTVHPISYLQRWQFRFDWLFSKNHQLFSGIGEPIAEGLKMFRKMGNHLVR